MHGLKTFRRLAHVPALHRRRNLIALLIYFLIISAVARAQYTASGAGGAATSISSAYRIQMNTL
jgi:hypothetical protein